MDDLLPVPRTARFGGNADKLSNAGVVVFDGPVGARRPDKVWHSVGEATEIGLALAQFTLGPLTLGDVTNNYRDSNDTAALIFDRRDGQRDRNQSPVFSLPHGFVFLGALPLA